mmetsp:Transcript_6934/g.14077  ORF Transcript_6934/g.14077 Transcript_6934/m.14077 type:complete len:270 (-) Transcript_6934:1003-1812(-)
MDSSASTSTVFSVVLPASSVCGSIASDFFSSVASIASKNLSLPPPSFSVLFLFSFSDDGTTDDLSLMTVSVGGAAMISQKSSVVWVVNRWFCSPISSDMRRCPKCIRGSSFDRSLPVLLVPLPSPGTHPRARRLRRSSSDSSAVDEFLTSTWYPTRRASWWAANSLINKTPFPSASHPATAIMLGASRIKEQASGWGTPRIWQTDFGCVLAAEGEKEFISIRLPLLNNEYPVDFDLLLLFALLLLLMLLLPPFFRLLLSLVLLFESSSR